MEHPSTNLRNVDHLTIGDRTFIIVGTAHVSQQSADLVRQVISEHVPDSVAVELCEGRYKSLREPDRWKNTNIATIIRSGKAYVLLAQLLLASYQKRLGSQLNIKPGAEMMEAVKAAEEITVPVVLADRDINITLRRTWASIGFLGLSKLGFSTVCSMLRKDEVVTEEEIERLKESDALEEVMREFSQTLPDVRKALIDERDQYLAQKIYEAPGNKVVAVVGAAHVPGIKRYIGTGINLDSLSTLPAKSVTSKGIAWAIPVLILGGMLYSFMAAGSDTATEMLKSWFWITGLFGALGAAVVRAHPVTTASAFIAAPFASLNPFIAAGWVAGLVEAVIRKPRVGDLETIVDDMSTVSGLLENRVSRTLLVVASTNLFVMIGMLFGAQQVYSIATEAHARHEAAESQVKDASQTKAP